MNVADQSLDKSAHSNGQDAVTVVPLAIVGIGCRFPKAPDLNEYWSNIRRGVDGISEIPDTHWKPEDYFDADPSSPDMTYAKRGGFIDPIDFDALEFGISPNNIEATDTTQLLGMYAARDALLDAGYETGTDVGDGRPFDRDRCSAILGVTGTLELVIPLGARLGHPLWRRALAEAGVDEATTKDVVERISDGYIPWQENSFPGLLGNVAAGRIANRFDLGGSNCVVDAACASSLSAIHMAAMELYTHRADMAITGGLDTFNDIFMYMCFSKTPALSKSGNSRPFDRDGDGTILGEGLGVVILKRLDDARRDGDQIYAVLKGIGSSSDGRGHAIYAPSADGQEKCLRDAYATAGVEPQSIGLVEAHGTGTKVGDATELNGLLRVYGESQSSVKTAVGSVKSMIGHTKAAAGAAGLIKAAMAVKHKVLPPTIKVNQPQEAVDPVDHPESPLYINTTARPWLGHGQPRRAALSAFGFGGSNFHCVVEEAESNRSDVDWDGRIQILPFSSASAASLSGEIKSWFDACDKVVATEDHPRMKVIRYWEHLRSNAASLRRAFDGQQAVRVIFTVNRDDLESNPQYLSQLLEKALTKLSSSTTWEIPGAICRSESTIGKLAVLFPGQGSQRVNMLRDLACCFPEMLSTLETADRHHDRQLSDLIYPIPVFDQPSEQANEAALRSTDVAQPALGAMSLGAWRILESLGLAADAFAGHSFGEVVALAAGGRISDEACARIACERGRLMAEAGGQDAGSMLAVLGAVEDVKQLVADVNQQLGSDAILIANYNSPEQCVLSGSNAAIDAAYSVCQERGLRGKRLDVAAAFHSSLVAAAATPFTEALQGVSFDPASPVIYANSTATPYPETADESRSMLGNQLARPVLFTDMIRNMIADGVSTFVELGPGTVLGGLVKKIDDTVESISLDASRGRQDGMFDLARVISMLAACGHAIDLPSWDPQPEQQQPDRKRVTVRLSGANYVKPKPSKPPRAPKPTVSESQPASTAPQSSVEAPSNRSTTPSPRLDGRSSPMQQPSPQPMSPDQAGYAFQLTQQSILAVQRLQEQTALLHRQYLEGQTVAQQTLMQLLDQQQRLLGMPGIQLPAMPAPVTPMATPVAPVIQPAQTVVQPVQVAPVQPAPVQPAPVRQVAPAPTPATPPPAPVEPAAAAPASPAPSGEGDSGAAQILLEVVAEKTGYPAEMLELDMSLDADLGIDSIKRVEILSAMQERMPDAPAVKPEDLGSLQTLRQIVEFIGDDSPAPAQAEHGQSNGVASNGVQADAAMILLEVVAEKTGYPAEMLELDMSLDADLGIDSIKRVEILSAMQERMPDAPAVKPEDLGTLQTLRQIVEFLHEGLPAGKA